MSATRTARRRRKQAKIGYRHIAILGHGNNHRPIIHVKSITKQQRHEALLRERRRAFELRKGASKLKK